MEQPIVSSLDLTGASSRDFTHLLKSNDVPLDSDIPFIRDIISHGQDRLVALDDQIDSLQKTLVRLAVVDVTDAEIDSSVQATLTYLTQTRDETAESVRQYRAVLHPVRCVPLELIWKIFVLMLLSESPDEDAMNNPRAPWRLGLICRPWRYAALSHPPLWCSITIPSSPAGETLVMMEAQLLRSGNAPLNIFWRGDEFVEPPLLELVVAHCSRWRTLRLNSGQPLFRRPQVSLDWLRPAAGRLAQLEKLEVVTSTRALSVPDVFITAPALREVILTDPEFTVYSPVINIPWAQVTHYRVKDRIGRQLEILKAASTLVDCFITIDTADTYFPSQDMVLLPRLRRLCVKSSKILDHIRAPLLEELSSLHAPRLQTFRVFLPFIQRCGCPLTKLVLMDCKPIIFELIPLLQNLPTLVYLLLGCFGPPQTQTTLFEALALAGTSSDLCPNLTSFLYGYRPTRDEADSLFPREALFAMVQSRFKIDLDPFSTIMKTPIQSLLNRPSYLAFLRLYYAVESPFPPPDNIVARLETLRDQGLDAAFLNYREFEGLKARGDFF